MSATRQIHFLAPHSIYHNISLFYDRYLNTLAILANIAPIERDRQRAMATSPYSVSRSNVEAFRHYASSSRMIDLNSRIRGSKLRFLTATAGLQRTKRTLLVKCVLDETKQTIQHVVTEKNEGFLISHLFRSICVLLLPDLLEFWIVFSTFRCVTIVICIIRVLKFYRLNG